MAKVLGPYVKDSHQYDDQRPIPEEAYLKIAIPRRYDEKIFEETIVEEGPTFKKIAVEPVEPNIDVLLNSKIKVEEVIKD